MRFLGLLEPPFLRPNNPKLSQPLFPRLVLQTLLPSPAVLPFFGHLLVTCVYRHMTQYNAGMLAEIFVLFWIKSFLPGYL